MNRIRIGAVAIASVAASTILGGPSGAADVTAVRSDGGLVATASFDPAPNGGESRSVRVVFVVPSGGLTSSDGSSPFARPWAAVRVTDTASGASCQQVVNPTEFSAGHRQGDPARLVGASVVVDCGGESYALHWGHSEAWLHSNAIARTRGEKVVSWAGEQQRGTVALWPDEQQPSPVSLCVGPAGGHRHCDGKTGRGVLLLSSTGVVTSATQL